MTAWSYFDRKVCLSLTDSEWEKGKTEFERVGLYGVERFQAVKEIGPHESFSHSERNILLEFYHSTAQRLLHLEDDCTFRNLDYLGVALAELPPTWDILYLGANLLMWNNGSEPKPERVSEHLFRIKGAWTTHAVAYNKKCVYEILSKQKMFSEQMFDQGLSGLLAGFQAYIVAPMVAYQRPRFSSIWNRFDDYTPIFEASDEKLNAIE